MRERLSRGKRKDNNEWVEGYFVKTNTGECKILTPVKNGFLSNSIIPQTAGDYTNLIDKSCKRIFEGDIVKSTVMFNEQEREIISVVELDIARDCCCLVCGVFGRFKDGSGSALLSITDEKKGRIDYEIIGNIHDNPELFKENK